jgi:hypothetical protein
MTVRPTSRFSSPGLALLAPAADRSVIWISDVHRFKPTDTGDFDET